MPSVNQPNPSTDSGVISVEQSQQIRRDTATLLLTLWAQQVDTLRNSLVSQIEPVGRDVDMLNRVTELMSKVSILHINIQSQELEAVGQKLEQLLELQEQPSVFDLIKNVTSTFVPWATGRGIDFSSLLDLATSFDEILSGGTNLLESYVASIQNSTAVNDQISNLINQTPGIGEIFRELESLGHDYNLQSLADLASVGTSLGNHFQSVANALREVASRVNTVLESIRSKTSELSQFDQTQLSVVQNHSRQDRKSAARLEQLHQEIEALKAQGAEEELADLLLEAIDAMDELDALNTQLQMYRSDTPAPQHIQDNVKQFSDDLDKELARVSQTRRG